MTFRTKKLGGHILPTILFLFLTVLPNHIWAQKKIDSESKLEYEESDEDGHGVTYVVYITGPGKANLSNGLTIPAKIGKWPVAGIVDNAFKGLTNLYYLTIESTYKYGHYTIQSGTFEGCTKLQSITFKGDAEFIVESGAFKNACTNVQNPFSNSVRLNLQKFSFGGTRWVFRKNAFEGSGLKIIDVSYNFYKEFPEIEDNAFGDNVTNITCRYGQSYALKKQWSEYADRISEDYKELYEDIGTDKSSFEDTEYEPQYVVLNRKSESPRQYFTLCLPFSIARNEFPDIETFATPTGQIIHNTDKDTYILILKEFDGENDTIPAGTPMLVKFKDGMSRIGFMNTSFFYPEKIPELSSTQMSILDWDGKSGFMKVNNTVNITYNGCFTPVTDTNNVWSFNSDGSFGPHSGNTLNAFRMYLTIDPTTSAQINRISIGDIGTTGIRNTIMEQSAKISNTIYTIDGRLVNQTGSTEGLAKGLYIQGGKKLIVK